MITLLSSPSAVMPVYNPIYSKVSSNQTTQEAFSFIFDVYVNGAFVNRDKLLPRPGTTQAIYSPARVLESYLNYDLTQNIVEETVSQNCIDKYQIIFGEEYITYWQFDDTQYDSYTSTSFTLLTSTVAHGFASGDYITITGTLYGSYNGVHKVETVVDDFNIIINKTFVVTPTNPGSATWSDKRKTEYIDEVTVFADGTNYALHNADWTHFGPDGCAVQAGIFVDDTIKLTVPDVSCGSALQYVMNTSLVLIPGRKYGIKWRNWTANNPSSCAWGITPIVGGTIGTQTGTLGNKYQEIICGAGSALEFKMDLSDADTGGFGSHTIDIKYITISLLPIEFTGNVFNGVIQYKEIPTWNYLQYEVGMTHGGRFLTNQPGTAAPVKTTLDDRGSMGFMNIVANDPNIEYFLFVLGEDNTGIPRLPIPLPIPTLGIQPTTNSKILEIPAYPWNLNQWCQSVYAIDVIDAGLVTYRLQIFAHNIALDTYTPASDTKVFELDTCGTRFEPVRFMFLNSLGQFDYFNATLASRTTINVTRDSYTKTLEYDYSVGDRGKTNININANESYTVMTDWIREPTAQWLSYELLLSREVYVLDNTDGSITPVVIDNNSMEVKKRVIDKLINYTFNYTKAVPVNTTRG